MYCVKESKKRDYFIPRYFKTKYLRHSDNLIRRLLNGEFYAVRSELIFNTNYASLFESQGLMLRRYPAETTQPTSSNSLNNKDSNQTSRSSSSFQLSIESLYHNKTLEIIDICTSSFLHEADSDEFIDAVN